MRGDQQVAGVVRTAREVLLSAIVVGELLYGFRRGSRFERNVADLRSFLDNPYVTFVPVGPTTADRYSRIAASLRTKGTPIPTNDMWIAAHAMETGADLLSADGHFESVNGIAWVRLRAF
jgi:tRNA(fMet)-specific endonuclease VapC